VVAKLNLSYKYWSQIKEYVLERYPDGICEWNFPGKKYGWSFRIKDKRRAIIYFLPRDNYFKVAFVFGQKATDIILNSDISESIKNELAQARKYAEGRGIRIEVNDGSKIFDIKKLVDTKLAY
jgi:hypothetical protein